MRDIILYDSILKRIKDKNSFDDLSNKNRLKNAFDLLID